MKIKFHNIWKNLFIIYGILRNKKHQNANSIYQKLT